MTLPSRRQTLPALALIAAAAVALPVATGAQSPPSATRAQSAAGKTVTALGFGQAEVSVRDRRDRAALDAAVEAAQEKAAQEAVAAARKRADALAKAAGLTLGAIRAVEEHGGPRPFVGGFVPAPPVPSAIRRVCRPPRAPARPRRTRRPPRPPRLRAPCGPPSAVVLTVSVRFTAT